MIEPQSYGMSCRIWRLQDLQTWYWTPQNHADRENFLREAEKQVIFSMAGPLRGGGGKGPAIKENNFF